MRIVGGRLKGLRFYPPKNLPVRPTTDLAKEALFNILQNLYDLDTLEILDLFCGTGNISLEFASRGAEKIISVDKNFGCYQYLKKTAEEQQLTQIKAIKADVFKFLKQETDQFDLIFADPPYDLSRIPEIPQLVFERKLLTKNGMLIVEHQSMQNLSNHPNFKETRKYGYSSFSFFEN
ncbi:MAG: RsmD family RNA methyltransferase [Bacteroidetes bacterium]|nr:RsmD family RNA methyltransferase [Bacteroidota bacterium]MBU1485789.1 RsmD family RNA methyltransferase [Bacteroidota bacterium]MBU1759235.1 RsmD family RNA methyltransferase [Bacteroidota bacterium]MBU2267584.1 RsmD family RNA methyltransferase [Bacteroidota bacterium]MBU2376270.1 RsmD family RNA methyltransferase [Bacteroidota bacterium]